MCASRPRQGRGARVARWRPPSRNRTGPAPRPSCLGTRSATAHRREHARLAALMRDLRARPERDPRRRGAMPRGASARHRCGRSDRRRGRPAAAGFRRELFCSSSPACARSDAGVDAARAFARCRARAVVAWVKLVLGAAAAPRLACQRPRVRRAGAGLASPVGSRAARCSRGPTSTSHHSTAGALVRITGTGSDVAVQPRGRPPPLHGSRRRAMSCVWPIALEAQGPSSPTSSGRRCRRRPCRVLPAATPFMRDRRPPAGPRDR